MNPAWESAVKRGDIHTVRGLVGRGMDVNARDRYGQTALMLAAHAGHIEIVETLIAYRADLNVTAKFGLSALMLAIISGHEDVASLLATSGADLLLQATGRIRIYRKNSLCPGYGAWHARVINQIKTQDLPR
jgi:ankyrin repeat protein